VSRKKEKKEKDSRRNQTKCSAVVSLSCFSSGTEERERERREGENRRSKRDGSRA
jgi:hypothetical protein